MSRNLTAQGRERVAEIAARYGVGVDAALTLLSALIHSGGGMAQFNHPELGGGGQWMRGGMTMVGDMFNHGLKAKVDGLCLELSALLPEAPSTQGGSFQSQSQGGYGPVGSGGGIFADDVAAEGDSRPEFGAPAWRGGQNDMRYAYYPSAHRLVVSAGGATTVYDTGDRQLQGVSQQQQNGSATLAFTCDQGGVVTLASLRPVTEAAPVKTAAPPRPAPATPGSAAAIPGSEDLAGTSWIYASTAGSLAEALTLRADGGVDGGDRRRFAYWAVERGMLRLFAEDGRPSAKFDGARQDESGRVVTLLQSADSSETLSRPGATNATAAAPEGKLVVSIELTRGAWDLEGDAAAPVGRLRLLADGRVDGGRPQEARWRADATGLSLLHGSGRPTARFQSFQHEDGRWLLSGVFIGEDAVACRLRQVGP